MNVKVGSIISNLNDLYEIKNQLVILHQDKSAYRVVYIGEYDIAKVLKYVENNAFFPYYNIDVQSIPEDIKNRNGVNARIKTTILSEAEMNAAGFSGKKGLGKKIINTPDYFAYKPLIFPYLNKTDFSALITINKSTGDLNVGVIDDDGNPYVYRDFINGTHGKNKTADMVMMQLEFWLAYFAHKGILTQHQYGTFIA